MHVLVATIQMGYCILPEDPGCPVPDNYQATVYSPLGKGRATVARGQGEFNEYIGCSLGRFASHGEAFAEFNRRFPPVVKSAEPECGAEELGKATAAIITIGGKEFRSGGAVSFVPGVPVKYEPGADES